MVLRTVLTLACLAACAAASLPASASAAAAAARKPNVIVIVADDLGYADLGVTGCRDVPTPHIDSIAANGVRCTNGYVSHPFCAPTRAGLMTGMYQQRFGFEFNPGPATDRRPGIGLPLDQVTLADRMRAAGYRTGIVGKWHLGHTDEAFHPLNRGFDEFFGFLGGSHSYVKSGTGHIAILRGREEVQEQAYLTDAFAREGVAFIERHRDKPFFLYWAFNAVHGPMDAADRYKERFATIADPKRRTYATMLAALDDAVGAGLAKLREAGIEDDTLIFFISDNGGPEGVNASDNGPLRGGKGQATEGGVRVPFPVERPAARRAVLRPARYRPRHPPHRARRGRRDARPERQVRRRRPAPLPPRRKPRRPPRRALLALRRRMGDPRGRLEAGTDDRPGRRPGAAHPPKAHPRRRAALQPQGRRRRDERPRRLQPGQGEGTGGRLAGVERPAQAAAVALPRARQEPPRQRRRRRAPGRVDHIGHAVPAAPWVSS